MATREFLRARRAWKSNLLSLRAALWRRFLTIVLVLGVCLLCA